MQPQRHRDTERRGEKSMGEMPVVRERVELLTRVAFFLGMVIVCARVGMGEALRDLMPVGPGTVAAPKGAGPATSLFLDLLCCLPAMLILLRRVMDSTYVLRWTWSFVIMG